MSIKQSITDEANIVGTFRTDGCNVKSKDEHDRFQFLFNDNFAVNHSNWGKC